MSYGRNHDRSRGGRTVYKDWHAGVLGGFSYTRRPYTIAREVTRQRDRIQKTFCTINGGASIEEALAANDLIEWLETTYVGLEVFSL